MRSNPRKKDDSQNRTAQFRRIHWVAKERKAIREKKRNPIDTQPGVYDGRRQSARGEEKTFHPHTLQKWLSISIQTDLRQSVRK